MTRAQMPDGFDPIEARIRAFSRLRASPCDVVCPCCGYPCMDCEADSINACDVCGWPIWQVLGLSSFSLDEPDAWTGLTLPQCRQNFLAHGDAWPEDYQEKQDDDIVLSSMRTPDRQDKARQCRAEWDAWLKNPCLEKTPTPVWRRILSQEQNLKEAGKSL